ncbi:MAG: M48 family metallopeptidase [Planctomycetota bacterium]|nr:M48 family metallopeptidase [Planctomycetota bacterium]
MDDASAGLSVTAHGGEFGVSGSADLQIKEGRALLNGPDGQRATIDLNSARAEILGSCISVRASQGDLAFSMRDSAVFAEVRSCAPLELSDQLDEMATNLRKRSWGAGKILWVSLLVLSSVAALLYFGVVLAVGMLIHLVPISLDQSLGKATHQTMLADQTICTDEVVNSAMTRILDSLRPHLGVEGIEPELVVVESELVNAYCLPGGYVTVFTGLLLAADNADEVAGVIAHELAHATGRHGVRQLIQTVSLAALVQAGLGDVSGTAALGGGLEYLIQQGYSRDHETEADQVGLRMVQSAGWDGSSMATFFEKLAAEDLQSSVPAWLSSHPDPGSRADSIREQLQRAPSSSRQVPQIDWDQLKAALQP